MLLSYVVDSAIELSTELGDYDHLVFTNPKWIENFGDSGKLKPIEYSSLSKSMQEFLDSQMPILTNDGSVLPEGTGLYEYEGGGLLAFPINVTLGSAKPIEAKNPLVMLIDNPAEILKADSCMLPLTSSGNVLFLDSDNLQQAFENSELKDYGDIQKSDIHGGFIIINGKNHKQRVVPITTVLRKALLKYDMVAKNYSSL